VVTVLVAGGAGYIGAFTCRALREAGYRAVVYDNLSTGHRELAEEELIVGDIRDGRLLREVLTAQKVGAVVHFAANALARESVGEPAKFYDVNVGGQIALLEACRAVGVGTFVFSSSCSIYGMPRHVPVDESHPQQPISPYGRTKLACEWMLRDYGVAYGLRYAALRYFIHVEDLARAHVLALDHLLRGGASIELNLGTGIGQSVRQVLDAVGRVVGHPVPSRSVEAHPGDPALVFADTRCARELLGFSCTRTDLDDVVASAWPFHRKLLGI